MVPLDLLLDVSERAGRTVLSSEEDDFGSDFGLEALSSSKSSVLVLFGIASGFGCQLLESSAVVSVGLVAGFGCWASDSAIAMPRSQ